MDLRFIDNLDGNAKVAWKSVFEKFYYEKTHLFYDHLSAEGENGFLPEMPTPEMIKAQVPSPSGWGTPLENTMPNNAYALTALTYLYKTTGDESILPVIHDVVKGFLRCATVSKQRGFLARSVAPDGESHYINSSRDMYTYWVYYSTLYYNSGIATAQEKEIIADCLVGFAEKAEREIHGENYEFLREDGKVGMVSQMWGELTAHEYLRLPMIYLAAYYVSGDEHWKEKYLEYREEAFSCSEKIYEKDYMEIFIYSWALYQMQLSLAFVRDFEFDDEYKERARKMMRYVSDFAQRYSLDGIKEVDAPQEDQYVSWTKFKMEYWGFYGGYAYFIPRMFEPGTRYDNFVKVIDSVNMQLLCEEEIEPLRIENFYKMFSTTDYAKCTSCCLPLLSLFAYSAIQYREKQKTVIEK